MARYHSLEQFRRFESVNNAIQENYIRADILKSMSRDECTQLANKLIDCADGKIDCNSLACNLCNLCNRHFRLKYIDKLVSNVRAHGGRWWIITIIDYSRAFSEGELTSFDVKKAKDRLRKLLSRSGFHGPIVGSFEVDFHDSCELWLPHFHLLCPNTKVNRQARRDIKQKLKDRKPSHIKKGKVPRPIIFQKLKNPFTQISYIFKLVFMQVVDFESLRTGEDKTRKLRLSALLSGESLFWMDQLGRRAVLFSFSEKEW
ncbi:TPA: hypothetical protein ACX6Q6_002936 [Photobacterium damselae]